MTMAAAVTRVPAHWPITAHDAAGTIVHSGGGPFSDQTTRLW